jgi:hypothetical protein
MDTFISAPQLYAGEGKCKAKDRSLYDNKPARSEPIQQRAKLMEAILERAGHEVERDLAAIQFLNIPSVLLLAE